jgi:hypothetical protein
MKTQFGLDARRKLTGKLKTNRIGKCELDFCGSEETPKGVLL